MNWKPTRTAAWMALVALATASWQVNTAQASSIPSVAVNLPSGSFSSSLGGSGTATLTGASGNYRQWVSLGRFLGWQSTNTGLNASNQTVPVNMPTVNMSNAAWGNADIGYDNEAPGNPEFLNSLNADLNGNQNYNFSINVSPLTINIGGIGNAKLQLTVNGTITNATFTSTGNSWANSSYLIPGNLDLTMQGTVTGTVVDILGISGFNLSLGTLFTLDPSVFSVEVDLPGTMLLTELTGGAGPYPADMAVNLGADVPFPIDFPITLPFDTSQTFTDPNNRGTNGFTSLNINPGSQIAATITLGNPSYSLDGFVPAAMVPEPSSLVLFSLAAVGLAAVGLRRRKAA